uniref:Uncharacterized protein n=1 Tax=Candidatus Kentrum sp. TC TaxID=2126339 RepID=A0A450ZVG4_9GAMM|nr:MAG: hypothetical protein BECKTC1821D_GA0114238_10179 [Candidatus Kentron sp. TC]VFK57737.1 MAG: hypothetical protein BECKTC1821F_GA0114240_10209 [Candidatus Kentron sp. TC]
MNPFVERRQDEISGALSCFDRVVITGTSLDIRHPEAMASLLRYRNIRLFDYAKWAEPSRDKLHRNAEQVAADSESEIELIQRSNSFRKEESIKAMAVSSPREMKKR